jgi:hypothetical protein
MKQNYYFLDTAAELVHITLIQRQSEKGSVTKMSRTEKPEIGELR